MSDKRMGAASGGLCRRGDVAQRDGARRRGEGVSANIAGAARDEGFSLVEVIVAMTLLIILFAAVTSLYYISLNMNVRTKQKVEATRVANKYLETAVDLTPAGTGAWADEGDFRVRYDVAEDDTIAAVYTITVTVYDAEGNIIEGIPTETKQWRSE
jgi:type II secretory pathway pseudopilin PulG